MSYTLSLDPDAADLLVAIILRDTIESDYLEEADDDKLQESLIRVHNYFSVPDKHIPLPEEDA